MLRPISALAALALLAAVAPANAVELIYNSGPLTDGNDCAGDLGIPPECYVNGSPLVAKFDFGPDEFTQGLFPSIDGSEFGFGFASAFDGTFTYTPNDADDPGIKYWSVKASNQYQIWWLTEGRPAPINFAVLIPTGTPIDWVTDGQHGISHISFYDTKEAPEPASLALLGLGLLGIGFARRRRS